MSDVAEGVLFTIDISLIVAFASYPENSNRVISLWYLRGMNSPHFAIKCTSISGVVTSVIRTNVGPE